MENVPTPYCKLSDFVYGLEGKSMIIFIYFRFPTQGQMISFRTKEKELLGNVEHQ